MSRKTLATVLGATLMLAGLAVTRDAGAVEVVSLGTLAPQKSTWGKVFGAWSKAVKKKSGGELELKWYYNAQQGDEAAMVAKIRSGQLDGAAVTSVGLSTVYKPIIALQMPGLFKDWETLDKARDAMSKSFSEGAEQAGFIIAGYGDVGLARTMSKGKEIRQPSDLKTMKVYRWKDDVIGPVVSSVVGFPSVPTAVPELLPALSSGRINVITVPCLAAVQLQWWSHLDHINTTVAGVGVGGLILSKERVDRLSADHRDLLLKTGSKAAKMLTKRIRKDDKKAYKMLKERMTVVKLTKSERKVWEDQFKEVRARLGQGVFSASLVKKLEDLAGL